MAHRSGLKRHLAFRYNKGTYVGLNWLNYFGNFDTKEQARKMLGYWTKRNFKYERKRKYDYQIVDTKYGGGGHFEIENGIVNYNGEVSIGLTHSLFTGPLYDEELHKNTKIVKKYVNNLILS